MQISRILSWSLAALTGLFLLGSAQARPGSAELMSDPARRAFVSDLQTWTDHGVLAWYGGAQEQSVIHLQRLDPTLSVYSRPIMLSDPSRTAYEPSLATIGNDTVVAWYEKNPESGAFYSLIARLDWSGHVKWHGTLSHPERSGRNPVVRGTPDGAWVAWLEPGEAQAADVWAEHLSADGQPLAPAQRVGAADRDTAHLNAAVDTAGDFYVVFDAKLGSRAREVQLLTIRAAGAEQIVLTHDDGAASVYPDIGLDGDRVALCWVDAREGHTHVRAAIGTRDNLAALEAASTALTRSADEVGGSYLAWNQGRLGVAWNATGKEAGIFLQRFDARGHPAGTPSRVARTAAPARPAVPVLAPWQKGFAVAWNEYTEEAAAHRVLDSKALRATVP